MTSEKPAVRVDDVGVRFRPFVSRKPGTPRRGFLPKRERLEVVALDGVTFEVTKGEAFGVIGANGAGKSTLLKVMAGTLEPDRGRVTRYGKLSPLLTLGAGFNAALSGRENILLGGLANGLPKAEIESKFDQIIDFSDLGDAIDRPMGTYSSGMFSRLAFSVAVNLQPEILLLDEVMAVGDAVFKRKSMRAMRALVERSGTIIFVSHQMKTVADLCQRALWLDKGSVKMIGPSASVVQAYREAQMEAESKKREQFDKRERARRGRPRREQRSDRGNIMIVGLAKTGTTGLYNTIKAGVRAEGSDYYCLFEPGRRQQLDSLLTFAPEQRILTKVMAAKYPSLAVDTSRFHKRILIHRDPRDAVISSLLFRPMLLNAGSTPEGVARFVEALRRREAGEAISVRRFHELATDLGLGAFNLQRIKAHLDLLLELSDSGEFQSVSYEAFVDGRIDDLAAYLDLPLEPVEETPRWLDHIDRSRSYGAWRQWFIDEDVDHFRPVFGPFLERYGYGDDWDVSSEPIDPSVSSEYVEKKFQARLNDSSGPDVEEDLRRLLELADDGKLRAMVRLARVHLDGTEGMEPDASEGARWAHLAAIQGHAGAMHLLARCFLDGNGMPSDRDRGMFWLKESARRGHEQAAEDLKDLTRARSERLHAVLVEDPADETEFDDDDEDEFDELDQDTSRKS